MADPTKATEYRKINDELVQVWPETVTDNISVKNYTKPNSTAAIANDDLLNTALGKLEKALDGKQAAGSYVPTSRKVNNKALSADITLTGADIALTGYTAGTSAAIAATDTVNAAFGKVQAVLTSHGHGSITSDGKIGTTSGLPLITTTGGTITTGSFGTTAGTFCQGNDSRLSDARTPTSHSHGYITNAGELASASRVVITDANKKVTVSTITITELGYLSGTSANIQTQINNINTSIAGGVTIKGTLGTGGTITALPASHTKGDAYYAIAGAPNVNSQPLEPGDMVICITTGTTASDTHWTVVQNNATTMVGATASAAGAGGFVPAPAAGDQNKVLAGNGTWVTNTGDTHHQAKLVISPTSNATANASGSNPYITLVENGSARSTHQVKGGGTTSVACDANGHITITGAAHNVASAVVASASNGTANTTAATANPFLNIIDGGAVKSFHQLSGTSPVSVKGSGTVVTVSHDTSGVTSGSYGTSANASPGYGGTFKVPYIAVNATGHVTSASDITITLPTVSDTKVTQNSVALTTNSTYPIIFKKTANYTNETNTINYAASGGLAYNPSTKVLNGYKAAFYGSALPTSAEITAMPDGACFLLLPA